MSNIADKYPYLDTRNPRIKRRGKFYWARFHLKGIEVRQSLKTSSFEVAEVLVREIEQTILLGEPIKKDHNLFADDWPNFLEAKAQGKLVRQGVPQVRESTIKEYIRTADKWFIPFFGSKRIDKISQEDFDKYIQHVRQNSKKGEKVKLFNHWKYLSAFFTYCVASGKIKRPPAIYNPDYDPNADDEGEDGVGINFSDEVLKAFRDAVDDAETFHKDRTGRWVKLWLYMLHYHGMRTGEITQLKKDRLDFTSSLIKLRKSDTKTREARKVPMHPLVLPYLKEQASSHSNPYLFYNLADHERPMDPTGFKKAWDILKEKVRKDFPEFEGRVHDFRHSYASRAFANPGNNPVVVAMTLGMSMKTAMKVYIHLKDEDLHQVTKTFSGRA